MSTEAVGDGVLRLLAGTELFKGLAADDLAACAARFRPVRFAKGQMLFGRGDVGSHLYVVAEGQVRLAIATSDGRELSFQIATAGALIGEIAPLDGRPRSAEATALTAVTAYALDRNAFRELWSSNPSICDALIAFLCWRVRDASERLEAIALYPLEVRLARFLLIALGGRQAPPGAACHWSLDSPRASSRSCSAPVGRKSMLRWARWRTAAPSAAPPTACSAIRPSSR